MENQGKLSLLWNKNRGSDWNKMWVNARKLLGNLLGLVSPAFFFQKIKVILNKTERDDCFNSLSILQKISLILSLSSLLGSVVQHYFLHFTCCAGFCSSLLWPSAEKPHSTGKQHNNGLGGGIIGAFDLYICVFLLSYLGANAKKSFIIVLSSLSH